jgi:hypothetical protein
LDDRRATDRFRRCAPRRALFERMTTESTVYRVIFRCGTKTRSARSMVRVRQGRDRRDRPPRRGQDGAPPVKSVSTITHPADQAGHPQRAAGATVLWSRSARRSRAAGRLRRSCCGSKARTRRGRRPCTASIAAIGAPSLGWYVRHEVVMTF